MRARPLRASPEGDSVGQAPPPEAQAERRGRRGAARTRPLAHSRRLLRPRRVRLLTLRVNLRLELINSAHRVVALAVEPFFDQTAPPPLRRIG